MAKITEEQEILLDIVKTWKPSEYPEYRGFRCANCQEYKNEAWYHWLNTDNYHLPVHMCKETCESKLQSQTVHIDKSKQQKVDRDEFGNAYKYSGTAIQRFKEIVASWPEYEDPKLKAFYCDDCDNELGFDLDGLRKGYHVWWKMEDGKTLAELHFHKTCGHKLGIYSKEEKST